MKFMHNITLELTASFLDGTIVSTHIKFRDSQLRHGNSARRYLGDKLTL